MKKKGSRDGFLLFDDTVLPEDDMDCVLDCFLCRWGGFFEGN